MSTHHRKGFTLVELVVSVGLFAIIMLLASGAYLVMINLNRQAQAVSIGINNLSFALEAMTRTIRTGTTYRCGLGDCPSGGSTFTVENPPGTDVTYTLAIADGGKKYIAQNGVGLTDPTTVNVTSLTFYVTGTATGGGGGEFTQPHVTIVARGVVSSGPGRTQPFNVETGATMRGTDI